MGIRLNLVSYLPPLADVSSTNSALPMNLTIKTTASEELDKLADLRGRLALEARREEKRKEEEARRLAVGRLSLSESDRLWTEGRPQARDDQSGS